MKIVFLWAELSSYIISCFEALLKINGIELIIIHWPSKLAPFDFSYLNKKQHFINKELYPDKELCSILENFDPDVVLVSGWMDKNYIKYIKLLKRKKIIIVCCLDNQYRGSLNQKLAILTKKFNVIRYFDILWVPGERGAQFAVNLGFKGKKLWFGLYSCDSDKFDAVSKIRECLYKNENKELPRNFLFVGQYSDRKGLSDLITSYKNYKTKVKNPWELHCAGNGHLKAHLNGCEGIIDYGFVQPGDIFELFKKAGVFVLPSHYEPWGVVIHEATTSGLPIICSQECGASVELVRDGYNGFLFDAGDRHELSEKLYYISTLDKKTILEMSNGSRSLSKQFSSTLWAQNLIRRLTNY